MRDTAIRAPSCLSARQGLLPPKQAANKSTWLLSILILFHMLEFALGIDIDAELYNSSGEEVFK
jgi:hypothetical protein